MELTVTALSRQGGRAENEDACGFLSTDGFCFCVVADGAGGHAGGATAAQIAVKRVLTFLRDHPACEPRAVQQAIVAANQDVLAEQALDARLSDMRSTVVVLVLDSRHGVATWGHLGDSRLYAFRDRALVLRTQDHSLAQKLIDTGYVTDADLRGSFQRARLYAALGETDLPEPAVIDAPFGIAAGDAFLLCTDGWWNNLQREAMERSLAQATSADDWLRDMERQILEQARPAQDNYSALAIWCR